MRTVRSKHVSHRKQQFTRLAGRATEERAVLPSAAATTQVPRGGRARLSSRKVYSRSRAPQRRDMLARRAPAAAAANASRQQAAAHGTHEAGRDAVCALADVTRELAALDARKPWTRVCGRWTLQTLDTLFRTAS